jgi:hypothetical protein
MAIARRIAAGALGLAATFGVLWAGAAVAHEATVTSPVARAMRLPSVSGYSLDASAASPTLSVRLRDGADLEAVCQSLDSRLLPVFGQVPAINASGPGQSHMTPLIEAAAVPIAQGIATGEFVGMSNAVERLAGERDATAEVEIDENAVYLTLAPKGGGPDAYAVFVRTAPGLSTTGGTAQ